MQVSRRSLKIAMAEQKLNGAQVGTGIEQMCREAVS
jgi:hypothetical protein